MMNSLLPVRPVSLLLLSLLNLFSTLHAFPSGAGTCNVGSAAVGGAHLSGTPTTGAVTLDTGYRLSVDGQAFANDGTPLDISLEPPPSDDDGLTERSHQLQLEALDESSHFKGFSIVASPPPDSVILYDLFWEVTDTTLHKNNDLCDANAGIVGLTHTNNDLKSSVVWDITAVVTQDAVVDTTTREAIPLDITIVVENANGVSEYYYSAFILNFVAEPRDGGGTDDAGVDDFTVPELETPWDVLLANDDSLVVFSETISQVPSALTLLQSSTNTLTVFGPTDAALEALDDAAPVRILTDPQFATHLEDWMLYHIHESAAFTNDALITRATAEQPLGMATTNGELLPLFLGTTGGTSFVELQVPGTDATLIIEADLTSTNSVVHAIDDVLLPRSVAWTMLEVLEDPVTEAEAETSTFLELLQTAGLEEVLTGTSPITILAPTNQAFANMDPVELEYLQQPENRDLLVDILNYHMTNGIVAESDLSDTEDIAMLNNKIVTFDSLSGRFTSTSGQEAELASVNTLGNNGIMHGITKVLIPEAIVIPTVAPTTSQPTVDGSTPAPTTDLPSATPSITTEAPTVMPTATPSGTTAAPTTEIPSALPSVTTEAPTTEMPSGSPSTLPSVSLTPTGTGPTTLTPTTLEPSASPTNATSAPTNATAPPSIAPTTESPSNLPSLVPSISPSTAAPTPTMPFTLSPSTVAPTLQPTNVTTEAPTLQPTNTTLPPSGTNATTGQPTTSPTLSSTLVEIRTTFVLFNTEGLEARDVTSPMYIGTFNTAYDDFVGGVVMAEARGSRFLRQQPTSRRLDVVLDENSPRVYAARDVVCPAATSDGSSIPGNANCQDVFGNYSLAVTSDEDPVQIEQQYTNATNQAVANGNLQLALDRADPNSPFTVSGLPPAEEPDKDDGGVAAWLIAVIVLCSALGLAVISFLIYMIMKPTEPEEVKEPFITNEVEVPPPPEDDPPKEPDNIEPVDEEEVWEDENEDDDLDGSTLRSIPEMTVVDITEDDVEEAPEVTEKEQKENDDTEGADWKDEDSAPNEGWEDEETKPEETLLLEDGAAEVKPVVEDEVFALEAIDDDDDEEDKGEDETPGEEKEDPPQSAQEGDAPGMRESQLGTTPELGDENAESVQHAEIAEKRTKETEEHGTEAAGGGDGDDDDDDDDDDDNDEAWDDEDIDADDDGEGWDDGEAKDDIDVTDGAEADDNGNQDESNNDESFHSSDDHSWKVPDISLQDENDVEDILRTSNTQDGKDP